MAHSMSGRLLFFIEDIVCNSPVPRCEHLKKPKEQMWAAFGMPRKLMCRECAVDCLQFCTDCGRPAELYFICAYIGSPSGNDPNYFIAGTCRDAECVGEVPIGEWGVRLLEFSDADGKMFFMPLITSTALEIPPTATPKVRKSKKMEDEDELELA